MDDRSVRITSEWQTRRVEPGTPYADDPSLHIPTGWYVLGGARPEGGADIVIHIHSAVDVDGHPIERFFAELIREVMDAAGRLG